MSDVSAEEEWPVEIIRSAQRRKTVSARLEAGVLIIRAPEGLSDAELTPIIDGLRRRMRRRSRSASLSDEALEKRAQELNHKYFGGKLRWQSLRYVTNQKLVNRYPLTERARGYLMAVGMEELEGSEVDGAGAADRD